MKAYWTKHSKHLDEHEAMKIIHKKIHKAKKHLINADKSHEDFLCELAEAGEMIDDLFESMGVNPTSYIQK